MDFLKTEIERKRKQIKATEAAKVVSLSRFRLHNILKEIFEALRVGAVSPQPGSTANNLY